MNIKIDWFIMSLLGSIAVAFFFPELGSESASIPYKQIIDAGITIIFFLYGLRLSLSALKDGMSRYKLHIAVQLSTFLLFPLLVLLALPFINGGSNNEIWLAVMFLATLPSTVSSSVVMVSIANGNVPAAIFNASISGLIGIIATPLWMGFFLQTSGESVSFFDSLLKLSLYILLPVAIGLFLHRWLGKWALKHKSKLALFDKSVIVLIVFYSFCKSFRMDIFSSVSSFEMVSMFVAVILLFFTVYYCLRFVSKLLNFPEPDTTCLQFCGSKKSLVHGSVFSKVLLAGLPSAGLFLLPVMIYHAFQLIAISFIAHKKSRKQNEIQLES